MVESPDDSPGKDNGILMLQTGLSLLLQKVNLKRKHDEDTESEEDKMETTCTKKQRHERAEEEKKDKLKGKKGVGRRKLGVKRTIEQRLNQARQTGSGGSGGCPQISPTQ